jgi:hypothetical protein
MSNLSLDHEIFKSSIYSGIIVGILLRFSYLVWDSLRPEND